MQNNFSFWCVGGGGGGGGCPECSCIPKVADPILFGLPNNTLFDTRITFPPFEWQSIFPICGYFNSQTMQGMSYLERWRQCPSPRTPHWRTPAQQRGWGTWRRPRCPAWTFGPPRELCKVPWTLFTMRRKKNRGWIFYQITFCIGNCTFNKKNCTDFFENKIQMRYPFQVIYLLCYNILHCPMSGPDLTYISLLIIFCIIGYVMNKAWILESFISI